MQQMLAQWAVWKEKFKKHVLDMGDDVTDLPIAQRIRGRDGRSLADVWSDGMVSSRPKRSGE